ncbi:MAG TPA: hypothetical protein VFA85_02380 [Terriglobales bacterium]|nr:hypothetical protein [Terriglobales bacterium]
MKPARRKNKRLERYLERGIKPPDLQSLVLDDDPLSGLQEDHVASRQHDSKLVAPVTPKAHQRLERNRNAAGVSRKYEKNLVKRTIQRLRSSAVFDELQAEAKWRWAEDLELSIKKNAEER